jgi:hypothetical protein
MDQTLTKELAMQTTQMQHPTRVEEREPLLATDRCDTCQAAAMVVATFINGELMFCGHHAKDKKDMLMTKAISIFDPNNILFPVN